MLEAGEKHGSAQGAIGKIYTMEKETTTYKCLGVRIRKIRGW
jgi:hypothetical protein